MFSLLDVGSCFTALNIDNTRAGLHAAHVFLFSFMTLYPVISLYMYFIKDA